MLLILLHEANGGWVCVKAGWLKREQNLHLFNKLLRVVYCSLCHLNGYFVCTTLSMMCQRSGY